jgi:hypothetical protein
MDNLNHIVNLLLPHFLEILKRLQLWTQPTFLRRKVQESKLPVVNHIGAVANHLQINLTWKPIYKLTQEKSLTYVHCVTKHLLKLTILKYTAEVTQEKSLTNVYCVTKHLLDLRSLKDTAEVTQEKSLTRVLNVPNHSATKETYTNIWVYILEKNKWNVRYVINRSDLEAY